MAMSNRASFSNLRRMQFINIITVFAILAISGCATNQIAGKPRSDYACTTIGFTDTVHNEIINVEILKSSGDPKLDEFAKKSVMAVTPPKRPPMTVDDIHFTVPICFPKDQRQPKAASNAELSFDKPPRN